MDEDKLIQERKEKIFKYVKNNPQIIFYLVLVLLVILGVYIRYMPLADHNGNPGLWDITTNDYTLGPDLDPFLFLRYAKNILTTGSFAQIDDMRYVPLGFDTTLELQMVSYSIVFTYRLVNIFGDYSINFAGAFMPVLAFALTIIAFFFFVREIFIRKNEKETYVKSNLIASIATLFMTIMPAFLSRTVAGIPEKESIAFLFMFLTFFLFLKAWKTEKIIISSVFGILAGVSTALMGLSWGGVTYVFITLGLAGFIAFILNKFEIKEICAYGLWLLSSFFVLLMSTNRFSLKGFLFGTDTGLACIVLILLITNYILWKTKISSLLKLDKIKLPKTVITLIIILILGLLILLAISPSIIFEKISQISTQLIKPITGRWNTTVAENAQPYFKDWISSFGKPIFWLIFAGSLLLFYKMIDKLKIRDRSILTCSYAIFFFGLVFSRYASHPALLDGENFISKLFWFGSTILLIGAIVYYYIQYHKKMQFDFEKIEFEHILLFALFVLTLFTARTAVRLIMVLVPIAPIFLSYLLVETGYIAKKTEKKDKKIIMFIICAVVIIIAGYYAYNYYQDIKVQAYNYVPYYYTYQWQNAMSWVRNNTPENAVFNHWWDYGYWVQSIGERATATDGGNAIVWWNYLTGRLVLTGDDQKEALNFLWNHNVSYFLIDSSDIGKYGAFSQIGSDFNYDRFSYGPAVMVSDLNQLQETAKGTIRIYQGNTPVDGDISYESNGTRVFLAGMTRDSENNLIASSAMIGVILETVNENNVENLKQPLGVFYSQGKQYKIPLRYVYLDGQIYDFKAGLNAAIRIIQKVDNGNNGALSLDQKGALIYISPKILKGFLGQAYILDNKLGNFNNFKLAHAEQDFIIKQLTPYLEQNGITPGDFVYYQGLRGPIKIWSIEYTGAEKKNEEYTRITPPDYITWNF